jgi:hypothetical protein
MRHSGLAKNTGRPKDNQMSIRLLLNVKTSGVIFLCIFAMACRIFSAPSNFATLAGQLPRLIEAGKGPFLVVADIEVPAGKLVTIEPGTVLLFRNFTGLHVQGRLVAEGTASKPVVFTSEFDRDYNPESSMYPNPYDWNGLYIHANAVGTSMSHTRLYYSVYGIISETKYIRVFSGSFANNGKTNMVIEGKEHFVADAPYTYELSLKDATVDGVPIRILKDPAAPKRNMLRYAGVGVFVVGTGLGIYYSTQWHDALQLHYKLSETDDNNLITNNASVWEDAVSEVNKNSIISMVSYCAGIIGAVGLSWSFTF